MLSIGLMSGTSMDGIDAALLETDGVTQITALGHTSVPYHAAFKTLLKATEFAVRQAQGNMHQAQIDYNANLQAYLTQCLNLSQVQITNRIKVLTTYLFGVPLPLDTITLDTVIARSTGLHVEIIKLLLKQTGYKSSQIDVVGYHGQTLYHAPPIASIIVGDGQKLANRTGITVVADFRSQDIAAGGQGAPLAPLYHYALAVRDGTIPLAVINCGGIANITLISTPQEADLCAFDTGPGNALIDCLIRKKTCDQEHMDTDGHYAQQGKVNAAVLAALYEKAVHKKGKNYFHLRLPKSLDYGDLQLIPELDALSLPDACATLAAFTADSIVQSLDLLPTKIYPRLWYLAGGGWYNPVILAEFKQRLKQKIGAGVEVITADQAGWQNKALEAQIFAYLAVRSIQNKTLTIPSTTGVSEPMSGGRVFVPITI